MPRFILSELSGTDGFIHGSDAHHLVRVHRVKVGDTLEVTFAGQGYNALVKRCEESTVIVALLEASNPSEPEITVQLLPALLKGDKLELVIQKAVELGVHTILPLQCERSIVPMEKAAAKLPRWQKIAQEAAKQSGRTIVPEILAPRNFASVVADASSDLCVIAHERGTRGLNQTLRGQTNVRSISLAIGPEGGFTSVEIEKAEQRGFNVVGIGPRIMRAETASLALLSIVMYQLGDLGR